MALKKFNYKLKENKKKPLIISGIIVLVLLVGVTIYNTYAAYKATTSYNILQGKIEFFEKRDITIAVKLVDDEGNVTHSEDFPTEGYTFDPVKSYCVNGAKVSYSNGSASITEVKGKEKCTLYFNEYGALAQAILANNTLVTTTPDFSQTATDTNTNIYKTEDDFGSSYYFRGATTNNYVQFGSYAAGTVLMINDEGVTLETETPMYWRIVRINGDGTIRLVYDGIEKSENGTIHSAAIGLSSYNGNDFENVNYGDSDVKEVVDTWYNTHLKTTYGEFVADGIFCNDKVTTKEIYRDYEGDSTYYTILRYAPSTRIATNKTPKLTCTRLEDRYTTKTNVGNGLLEHPVGLLTADEVAFAGGVGYTINSTYYLYSGDFIWTSSPGAHSEIDNKAEVMYVDVDGNIGNIGADADRVARPVINLKANVEFTGNGSFETPFVIKTN